MLVVEILFLPLMTCLLFLVTRALDSYKDSTGEYLLFVHTFFIYEAFSLIIGIFFLTNDRHYRILAFFKLMLHETKEIHRKLVTTFGHIQGFQYESPENLVRFYLHSFVIFTVHCYPFFILFLNLDGMIPKLLGVLFTMSLLFESIDASDRLLRIVRFASCIIFVCICCGLIVFQLFECFLYTILTLLLIVFWIMRPNRRPFYLIFNFINRSPEEVALEPMHNVDSPEGRRSRLVENEERVLEQFGDENAFRDEILEPQDGFQLMEANPQLHQREDRPMRIQDYQLVFNEIVARSLEGEQMNPGIDRDQLVPEQLNQWIDRNMEPEQFNIVFELR